MFCYCRCGHAPPCLATTQKARTERERERGRGERWRIERELERARVAESVQFRVEFRAHRDEAHRHNILNSAACNLPSNLCSGTVFLSLHGLQRTPILSILKGKRGRQEKVVDGIMMMMMISGKILDLLNCVCVCVFVFRFGFLLSVSGNFVSVRRMVVGS